MTQVDFKGCSLAPAAGDDTEPPAFRLSVEPAGACSALLSSRLSPGAFEEPESAPGVFGAPKDAKAPDPRPKADDALVDGEETPPPERGDIALKGFDRPWELSGPRRFDVRGSSTLAPASLLSEPVIDSDNLAELERRQNKVSFQINWSSLKWDQNCRSTHLARRVHKLALSIETVSETAQKRNGHQGGREPNSRWRSSQSERERERHNDQTTSSIYRRDGGVVGREANERDADSRESRYAK